MQGQKPMKASGIFVTVEELKIVNEAAFPLVAAKKLIEKYHMPADVGFVWETGEFYYETME